MKPNYDIIAAFREAAVYKYVFDRALPEIEAAYAGLIRPDHHMWNYCLPLGQFTTSDGDRIDLGVNSYFDPSDERPTSRHTFTCGNVWGDHESEYSSGDLSLYSRIAKPTTYRAIQLGLVKREWFEADLFMCNDMFELYCTSTLSGFDLEELFKANQRQA